MNQHKGGNVEQVTDIPAALTTPRREANLLWYGPSTVFGVPKDGGYIGTIRTAIRNHDRLRHGLVTDLVVEQTSDSSLAVTLIKAAEDQLRADGVTKIDAVVQDGQGRTVPFLEMGYWASRKMVVIAWDLSKPLPTSPVIPGVAVEVADRISVPDITDFILHSYQPYWQWWKNDQHDRPWERIDYPAAEPDTVEHQTLADNRVRIERMLLSFNTSVPQRMVIARRDGQIIGLCDAKAVTGDDTFDWGVLMTRDHPGKGFGQALLLPALAWLREQGMPTAQATTTSGMDDYDPTVYLYTQTGGPIRGEFLNLVKHRF